MKAVVLLAFIVCLCVANFASCHLHSHHEAAPLNFSIDVSDKLFATAGSYILNWRIDETSNEIYITLNASTTGWVGFGINRAGSKMPDSDIHMGYVNDNTNQVVMEDRYATARSLPVLDQELNNGGTQDLTVISGSQSNLRTIIQYKRALTTSDSVGDVAIVSDALYTVVLAMNTASDPSSNGGTYSYHDLKGTIQLILYPSTSRNPLPDNAIDPSAKTVPLIFTSSSPVSTQKTTYVCQSFDLENQIKDNSQISTTASSFAVAIEPVVKNPQVVHHMVLYGCDDDADWPAAGSVFQCNSMNKGCNTFLYGWAIGGKRWVLPKDVGIAVGQASSRSSKVVLQMHYDNPTGIANIIDRSGINIYYKNEAPKNEARFAAMGPSLNTISIPPGQAQFQVTASYKVPVYAKVVTFFPHGHQIAKSIVTKVKYVNGTVDDKTFAQPNFDFNYQDMYTIPTGYQLTPGMRLETTCTYDSTGRTTVTVGGEDSDKEMCFNFLAYYQNSGVTHGWASAFILGIISIVFLLL